MYKSLLPAFLFAITAFDIVAQNAPKVLFDKDDVNISGFGAMMLEFSSIEGNASISSGGGGAVLFNNSFFAGGYGLSLANQTKKYISGNAMEVEFTHGGLYAGYAFFPHKMIHFGLSSRLGWGILRFNPENAYISSLSPSSDHVFVWTPQAEVEMNIAHWFKVNAGIGYRSVAGMNNAYYIGRDFSGPALTLSFLFGWFN